MRKVANREFLNTPIGINPCAQQAEHVARQDDIIMIKTVYIIKEQICQGGIPPNFTAKLGDISGGTNAFLASLILGESHNNATKIGIVTFNPLVVQ